MRYSCATISALKLWDFKRIEGRKETYYEAISLSVWSSTELSIGIVVANLPCLRKYLDGWFSKVLPGSFSKSGTGGFSGNKSGNSHGYNLPALRSSINKPDGLGGKGERLHSRDDLGDGDSDKAILEEADREDNSGADEGFNGIMKTTHVHIHDGKDSNSMRP
jgi:hypothetical protein